MSEQGLLAAMFYTDDVKGYCERIRARGAGFTVPPTEVVPGSTIGVLNDTCGNRIKSRNWRAGRAVGQRTGLASGAADADSLAASVMGDCTRLQGRLSCSL